MAKDEKKGEAAKIEKAAEPATSPETPGRLPRYSVEIPGCLLGRRIIPAETPELALATYQQLGGITSFGAPAQVALVDETKRIA